MCREAWVPTDQVRGLTAHGPSPATNDRVNHLSGSEYYFDAAAAASAISMEEPSDAPRREPSCVAPSRFARIDQFELYGGRAKNSDHDRLLRAALDAVVMRRVGDSSDKAPGRHGNGGVRVEIGAAVHPPCARQHNTQPIGRVAVRCAHKARVPFHQHDIFAGLVQPTEKRCHFGAVRRPGGPRCPSDLVGQSYLGFRGVDRLRATGGQAERQGGEEWSKQQTAAGRAQAEIKRKYEILSHFRVLPHLSRTLTTF